MKLNTNEESMSKMKTIKWNKVTHNRITVIPDNCQIIISAEHNNFVWLYNQNIGFHMQHYIGGPLLNATFLWNRKIHRIFGLDNIGYFEAKHRYPRLDELIVVHSELRNDDSVLFTTDIYKEGETEIGEIIQPVKELPIITWNIGDGNVINVPDECIINLPKEYNFVHGCFDYFLCISHFNNPNDERDALKLIWSVPIKRIPVKINSKNPDFKITERFLAKQPLWTLMLKKYPYKITDPAIKGIRLEITLHLDDKLRAVRLLTFSPIEE